MACFPFTVGDLTPSGTEPLGNNSTVVFKKQHYCRQRDFRASRWCSFSWNKLKSAAWLVDSAGRGTLNKISAVRRHPRGQGKMACQDWPRPLGLTIPSLGCALKHWPKRMCTVPSPDLSTSYCICRRIFSVTDDCAFRSWEGRVTPFLGVISYLSLIMWAGEGSGSSCHVGWDNVPCRTFKNSVKPSPQNETLRYNLREAGLWEYPLPGGPGLYLGNVTIFQRRKIWNWVSLSRHIKQKQANKKDTHKIIS